MAPGLRSNTLNEDLIIPFLKSEEFNNIIKQILSEETMDLHKQISELKNDIVLIKDTNNKLINMLSNANFNSNENINSNVNTSSGSEIKKATYADKMLSKKTQAVEINTDNFNLNRNLNVNKNKNNKNINSTKTNSNEPESTNIPANKTDDNWVRVQSSKRHKKQNIIVGSSSDELSIRAAEKYAHFHVFRTQPDLTEEKLGAHLTSKNIIVTNCEKLPSKHPESYSSFKVTVPFKYIDDFKDPNIWPLNVCINRFLFHLKPAKKSKIPGTQITQ